VLELWSSAFTVVRRTSHDWQTDLTLYAGQAVAGVAQTHESNLNLANFTWHAGGVMGVSGLLVLGRVIVPTLACLRVRLEGSTIIVKMFYPTSR
jgi:hypothetical protein